MRLKSFLVFLFFSVAPSVQSQFQITNGKEKVALPFQLINNLIFIQVVVNGQELTFLLDTGVEQTVLFSLDDKNEIKLFDVQKLKLKGLGSNEEVESYKSSKNKVQINDFVDFDHVLYLILDQKFNFSSQIGIPVNGIMGYNFFKNHLVEINYERKKIIIYNHNYKPLLKIIQRKFIQDSINIEESKPYLISNIKANNQIFPSKLLVDTGNSDAVWIFRSKFNTIELPQKNIQDYLGRGFSGNIFGKRARINSFEFGKKIFEYPLVTFPDSISIQNANFVQDRIGSVGGEILSRFIIIFDYLNGKIYTRSNNKLHDPFHFNMSGIDVEHAGLEWVKETADENPNQGIKIYSNGNDQNIENSLKIRFTLKPIFKISNIRVDSEAEKSGLKVGDRILKINREPAQGFTIQLINELLKSEEGKTIEIEVERNNKNYIFKFQLKNII
ncbi:aspartyl protease family protein [Flavobacterium sp.]|uniref:aspartyl protease family protein n=1 Tax=Flavobacterium sp. TaxID=239 RepID=UPI002601175C|nr:aspartyl protease family protein [Flavobacterium sp.]